MTTATQRARTTHRALADQRLSDLTFAAAVGGLAATIGFGWLAAITYAGVGSTPVGQGTLTIPGTRSGSNSSSSTTNGGSTTTGQQPSSNGGTVGSGSSSGVSRSSGRAHVATGSS
jgi:hypothetical protein